MTRFPVKCVFAFCVLAAVHQSEACTNLLVTSGASADGSVIITYTCDGEFHPHLRHAPAADHDPGSMLDITDWSGNLRGQVTQAPHTYGTVSLMNEHQLVIAETTFVGREELINPEGLLHYFDPGKYEAMLKHLVQTCRETLILEVRVSAQSGNSVEIRGKQTLVTEAWLRETLLNLGLRSENYIANQKANESRQVWIARKAR